MIYKTIVPVTDNVRPITSPRCDIQREARVLHNHKQVIIWLIGARAPSERASGLRSSGAGTGTGAGWVVVCIVSRASCVA